MSIKKKVVWLPYDMDTAIGINNDGQLVFDYRLEDIDYQAGGEPIFNGQDSVIWKNIRAAFADELKTMYQNLRASGALSYDKVEEAFEEHQAKWAEAIFNEDSYFKYIEPFVKNNQNYLYMLQGSKAEQRKWWLYNRFRYIDSKYVAGDARNDSIFLRPYAVSDITVTPYADIYATVAWDATITQERATRGTAVTLHCPYSSMNGNIVNIYSSSQLAFVGDLSGLKVGQANIASATRLQALKIGDASSSYSNANLYDLTFGNNVLLKTVDVRNCVGFGDTTMQGHTQTTVDLSGCSIIEEVYFTGTKIQGITLPNGGVLKKLHLPETLVNLTILNQNAITEFVLPSYSQITTLRIENSSSVIPVMDILDNIANGSRVRLIGFTTTASGASDAAKKTDVEDFYDYLDNMRGLDENGNETSISQAVQGTITGIDSLTGAWLAQMKARYPYIDITYNHITSNLYYYNGETLYYTETITDGGNGVYAGTPTKANSADGHYSYTFAGWSKDTDDGTVDADARTAVTADRNVYACYTQNVRTYTVTWVNNGTTIETDSNVPWGTVPHYDGSTPTKDGQTSTGWLPDPTQPITGNTTFTAQYLPVYTVTFKNDTGTTTLDTQNVVQGQTATYGGSTPTSSEDASLAFLGWATTANAHQANAVLTNVQSDMTVYAAFESSVEVAEITDSWDTIIANIDNGTYSTKYKIGNYKPLDLGTEGTINMQIVAMDADELASGGYAPLTFIGMELLASVHRMNPIRRGSSGAYTEGTGSIGGWEKSEMRTYLKNTVKPLIPSNVQNRLQRVNKYSSIIETDNTLTINSVTVDDIWIPSSHEVVDTITDKETLGATYWTVFRDVSSRIKELYGYTSQPSYEWFLRTAQTSSTFGLISSSGATTRGDAEVQNGVCLGFCLGLEPETITDSWSTILANTNPSASYSIGDTKYIDLGTEGKHLMEIVAFNEDDKADGTGKAKITWISKTLLNTKKNFTGKKWSETPIRSYLQTTVDSLIPSQIKAHIVPVTKIQAIYESNTFVKNGETTTDSLWIPSAYEVGLSGTGKYEDTGATYETMAKIKKTTSGVKVVWWIRSGVTVSAQGRVAEQSFNNSANFPLGFCTD